MFLAMISFFRVISSGKIVVCLILFFALYFFPSVAQEVSSVKDNNFYHTYKKEGDIIRVYDVDKNLVREAHLDKDIAYEYFDKKILLSHLESKYLRGINLFKSKKTIEFLYDSMERNGSIPFCVYLQFL